MTFEEDLEPKTDYINEYLYREEYIGRYEYVFNKETKDLEPFEMALKWYLKMQGYDHLMSGLNDEPQHTLRMKRIEEEVDAMILSLRIPLKYVDEMRRIENE